MWMECNETIAAATYRDSYTLYLSVLTVNTCKCAYVCMIIHICV